MDQKVLNFLIDVLMMCYNGVRLSGYQRLTVNQEIAGSSPAKRTTGEIMDREERNNLFYKFLQNGMNILDVSLPSEM